MENRFIFLGEVWFLAFEIRSDSIKVKIVTSIVERGGFAIDITPIGADLGFLIERSAVRTQESEVLDLKQAFEKSVSAMIFPSPSLWKGYEKGKDCGAKESAADISSMTWYKIASSFVSRHLQSISSSWHFQLTPTPATFTQMWNIWQFVSASA